MVDAIPLRRRRACSRRAPSLGLTYLWVLLAVAVLGTGLAAVAEVWVSAAQREREAELLFIGEQFRRAIGSYYEATPGAAKRFPKALDEMLEDRRFPDPRRHLRQLYVDPMTGEADWGVVLAADKTIMGVYSKATGLPFRRRVPPTITPGGPGYGPWQFVYSPVAVQVGTNPGAPGAQGPVLFAPTSIEPMLQPQPAAAPIAEVPAVRPAPPASEKSAACVQQRSADLAVCTRFGQDPKGFEICRRSSNQRYGSCLQGGSVGALRTD